MSVLLLLGVSTVILDDCDFSLLLTVSIFFFSEIRGVMAYLTTIGYVFFFLSTMSVFPSLTTVSVVKTNAFLVSSKSPLVFLTFSLGLSDSLGNGPMILDDTISVIDLLHPVNSIISSRF